MLRIAWFSPLLNSPSRGGSISAYVTGELLPYLTRQFEIELYHDAPGEQFHSCPVRHYLRAARHHQQKPYDLFFYQLEDSPSTNFSRIHLGLKPGVVLFHDVRFTTAVPETIRRGTNDAMESDYRSCVREASYSVLSLFSTERNLEEFKSQLQGLDGATRDYATGHCFHLPYPVSQTNADGRTFGKQAYTIGLCGGTSPEYLAFQVLPVLAEYQNQAKLVLLVDENERESAAALLNQFHITHFELRSPRSPLAWKSLVSELDIAIHPLYSAHRNFGPYLPISLEGGVSVIATNYGAVEYLPDNCLYRVCPGDNATHELRTLLSRLLGNAKVESGSEVRCNGKLYAHEIHRTEKIAGELATLFNHYALTFKAARLQWEASEERYSHVY